MGSGSGPHAARRTPYLSVQPSLLDWRCTACGLSGRSQFHRFPGAMPRHWLMKSEPSECSIDDLAAAPRHTVPWVGVRNYQSRNAMRDLMTLGDNVLFYHSSCAEPGIAGLASVASAAYPDATQFDTSSPYFDPKATLDAPRWLHVDVKLRRKTRLLSLRELREAPELASMLVLKRGNRLSITPVSDDEWQALQPRLA